MAALSVQVPYPVFYDRDGQPLDNGNIYIGDANLDPVTNPLQVYYDEALTIPASQPLKTSNGYIYRNGTPAQLYVNAVNFSILVKDEKGLLVYSFPDGTGISPNASGVAFTGFKGQVGFVSDLAGNDGSDWIGFDPDGVGAVARSAQDKMRDIVSVKDFGAVGDGVTDDTAAIQAALDTGYAEISFPSGNYKTTATLYIRASQTLRGVAVALQPNASSAHYATIMFRPTGADKVAIKNAVGTNGNSLRDMAISLNNATHYGVQLSTTYGNVLDGLLFFGTFDIGILLEDAYVCDLNRITMSGCLIKRFGIYVGSSNSVRVSRFHTSVQPQSAATCMYGLAIYGPIHDTTIADCLFQGPTIGIALGSSGVVSTNILNAYFENCVCPLRAGSPAATGGPAGLTIIGGIWGGPYASHPQYADRGPTVWLRYGTRFSVKGARFDETPAPSSATGPWSILCGLGQTGVDVEACSIYNTTDMRSLLMLETAGASPSITVLGNTYGSYGATELVLKKDGAYGGTSYGLRVDSAGSVTTSAYTPTLITGAPSALLSTELPAPSTLLL